MVIYPGMKTTVRFLLLLLSLLGMAGCGGGGGAGSGTSVSTGGSSSSSSPVVSTTTPPVSEAAPETVPFIPVEICSSASRAPTYLGDPFWAVLSTPTGSTSLTPAVTVEQPNPFAASLSCI